MGEMQSKRVPIKKKVSRIVLLVTFSSLVVAGVVGLIGMLNIRTRSITILLEQTESNLISTVKTKAAQAESKLEQVVGYARMFSDYAHDIYLHKTHYKPHPVLPPNPVNAGKYAIQRCIASEDYHLQDFKAEMDLLGNLEQIYAPIIKENATMKMNVYAGAESGFLIGYDEDSGYDDEEGEDYYNYFESTWYSQAKAHENVFFTDVYADSIGRGLTISCAAPFYNENDVFAGAFCLDIHIEDVYRELVDISAIPGATAFLVDRVGNTISMGESINVFTDRTFDTTVASKLKMKEAGLVLAENGSYYAFAPILCTDWEVCISIPKKVVMAPIHAMNQHIFYAILLFALVLILMIVLALLEAHILSANLTQSLEELTKDVQEISAGNLDKQAQVFSNDEIGDVANGVNQMAASLKAYIANLTTVTAEKEKVTNDLKVANQLQHFYTKVLDTKPE